MHYNRESIRSTRAYILRNPIRAVQAALFIMAAYFITPVMFAAQPSGATANNGPTRFYASTGHSVGGAFLKFYDAYGGLASFGYPISDPIVENGYKVQYFERQRFEYHTELANTPNEVLLSRLGAELVPSGVTQTYSPPFNPQPQSVYFSETRHSLKAPFLDYWKANGGLRLFGYPVTEAYIQDGLLTQYFERARMEHHPELGAGSQAVQLGLLGHEYVRSHPAVASRVSASSAGAQSLSSKEGQLLQLINNARQERGLQTVSLDPTLKDVALIRSTDMVERGYFSHTSPNGNTLFTILKSADIEYKYAGEIIANNNYPDAQTTQQAFDGFMASVSHRDIILDARYTLVGIGEAANAKGFHFFTAVFLSQ